MCVSKTQDTFTVVLLTQPTDNVLITFDTNDTSEGVVDKTSLTFTPSNWDVPQTVTITGIDDGLQDGDRDYRIIFDKSSSNDNEYNNRNIADVYVTNYDND